MKELLFAVLAAIVGAISTWMLGKRDRKLAKQANDIQMRNLKLEEENAKLLLIDHFFPKVAFSRCGQSDSFQQYIDLSSNKKFSVVHVEYLSVDNVCHASDTVNIEGFSVKVPLNKEYLLMINRRYFNGYDGTSMVKLRLTVEIGGHEKQLVVDQKIQGYTLTQFVGN